MNGFPFEFNGAALTALPSGALWWPARALLCVSDLHFGKSERIARNGGGLLPPYEAEETLTRLADDIGSCNPTTVVSLGDSFDDVPAAKGLLPEVRDRLIALQAGRRWIWIAGNHDPAPIDLGGDHMQVFRLGSLNFRHEATAEAVGEVSGHYHPKMRIARSTRPVFLMDSNRLIMPAYGTYTGGLRCDHAALSALMQPTARAILTGSQMAAIPIGARS